MNACSGARRARRAEDRGAARARNGAGARASRARTLAAPPRGGGEKLPVRARGREPPPPLPHLVLLKQLLRQVRRHQPAHRRRVRRQHRLALLPPRHRHRRLELHLGSAKKRGGGKRGGRGRTCERGASEKERNTSKIKRRGETGTHKQEQQAWKMQRPTTHLSSEEKQPQRIATNVRCGEVMWRSVWRYCGVRAAPR